MISVVMPTLWRGEHYKTMLPLLDAHPLIGEIFIINNNCPATDHETLGKLTKLVHFQTKGNLFVNPSWNYGVKHGCFDKVCLYSDDVLFDIKCLEAVNEQLTPENGIFGFHNTSIFPDMSCVFFCDWETPKVVPTNSLHYRFGICMFMHKESYYEIPNQFKIYYGDTYLFEENVKRGKQNYRIENYYAITPMSVTSKSAEFKGVLEKEKEEYGKLCFL